MLCAVFRRIFLKISVMILLTLSAICVVSFIFMFIFYVSAKPNRRSPAYMAQLMLRFQIQVLT